MLGSRSRYLTELKMNCFKFIVYHFVCFYSNKKIEALGLYICMPVNSNPAKRFNKTHNFDFYAHKKILLCNYLPKVTLNYNVLKIFLVQPQSVYDNKITQ